MLTHEQVWRGVDRLALRNGLSPSGLAKRAGLDPTTFNKSKRITHEGKQRWPSTESLSKILHATQTTFLDFVGLIDEQIELNPKPNDIKLKSIRLSKMDEKCFDRSGFPISDRWEDIDFPQIEDIRAYILEIDKEVQNSFLRSGDLVVVSPSSSVRRHDRILILTRDGEIRLATLKRKTSQQVTMSRLGDHFDETTVDAREIVWLARLLWVSL